MKFHDDMTKRLLFSILLLLCFQSFAQRVVVLYDNDVHCAVDGYPKLAHLKKAALASADYVVTVSSGDFAAGASLGAVSKGLYPVRIMNAVGYDFVTLGNHEFDYKVSRLFELTSALSAQTLCCNFGSVDGSFPYQGYSIARFDDVDIAFVGVATPSTPTSSTPTYFMDDQGRMRYTFCADSLYRRVQRMVDQARADGARYVVLLSHLGDEGEAVTSLNLIAHTSGIDVLLDGHSHNVIPSRLVPDLDGHSVLLSSTGAHFSHVGKLTIEPGKPLSTELIPLHTYRGIDTAVAMIVGGIQHEYDLMGRRPLGSSRVRLVAKDQRGMRPPRYQETNLGDFCADALRSILDADIAWVNGGALRANIDSGAVTFNHIYSLFPFGNNVSVVSVTGQQLLDNLEVAVRHLSNDNGGFIQTSGLTYHVDTTIASSVHFDSNDILLSVGASRRVHHVQVFDRKSQRYVPLDPSASYSLASLNYLLFDHGNGFNFFHPKPIALDTLGDLQAVESYLDRLGGVVDSSYALPQGRILFDSMPLRPSEGYWKAIIAEASLPVNISLSRVAPDSLQWSFHSPAQTSASYPASSASWKGDTLRLRCDNLAIRLKLAYHPSTGILEGSFRQGDLRTHLTFTPSDTLWSFPRPQTPLEPFPYAQQPFSIDRKDRHRNPVHIDGTLTFPDDNQRHPAVILVSGSGQQNRDEEIFGHKPFLLLADYLTRRGFAVLRYDDRGVGGSTGEVRNATTLDFADDVEALFKALRRNKHVDPRRIAILGHSEGGLIAPIVASRCPQVAALVLLAAPGVDGGHILLSQNRYLCALSGAPDHLIDLRLQFMSQLFAMMDSLPSDRFASQAMALADSLAAHLTPEQRSAVSLDRSSAYAIAQQLSTPWMRTFVTLHPAPYLRKVRCPILALNGELDCQVSVHNLDAIRASIPTKNQKALTIAFPNLNHLFQHCQTGAPSEYLFIDQTLDPEVLLRVSRFLLDVLMP